MENLDKLQEYINASTMTLIINNNSKSLLDALFNVIYNKYNSSKCKIITTKRLMLKLATIKNKLIRHDLDLSRLQFSSTRNSNVVRNDFNDLKIFLIENNSKFLLKFDIREYKINEEPLNTLEYFLHKMIPQYDTFNLIVLICKKDIKILRFQTENSAFSMLSPYGNKEGHIFDITTLIRSTKLKKIQKLYGDDT